MLPIQIMRFFDAEATVVRRVVLAALVYLPGIEFKNGIAKDTPAARNTARRFWFFMFETLTL